MDNEAIKQLTNDINRVVDAQTKPLRAKIENLKEQLEVESETVTNLQAENKLSRETLKELVLATPGCCWRKCWNCGKSQIHRDSVTPGVLCRFCGSQDTRLLEKETQALKGE